jgi:hypothetical protein
MHARNPMTMAIMLPLCLLAAAGCSTPSSLDGPPGQWNPSYWAAIGRALLKSEVANGALHRLAWRSGLADYWRLSDKAVAVAPDAEYLIIVEQLPEGDASEYWFVLIAGRPGKAIAYTGKTKPFAQIDLGTEDGKGKEVKLPSMMTDAEHRLEGGGFQKLLGVMKEAGIWGQDPEVYSREEGAEMIGQAPVMMHVYRRFDDRWVDFLLTDPVVTPMAIRGQFDLGTLKDPANAWFGAPRRVLQEISVGGLSAREKLFTRALPARIVLNGVLMLLYNERE